MRIPRFTVRRLMIAVAAIAALMATYEAGRREERRQAANRRPAALAVGDLDADSMELTRRYISHFAHQPRPE